MSYLANTEANVTMQQVSTSVQKQTISYINYKIIEKIGAVMQQKDKMLLHIVITKQ